MAPNREAAAVIKMLQKHKSDESAFKEHIVQLQTELKEQQEEVIAHKSSTGTALKELNNLAIEVSKDVNKFSLTRLFQ